MSSAESADELRRAVEARSAALVEICASLKGPLSKSRSALKRLLSLVSQLPEPLCQLVEQEWGRTSDPDSRVALTLVLLRHLNFVAGVVEKHLAHGTRQELSQGLMDEVHHELESLKLGNYSVVIAHGPANNFVTLFGDISKAFFGPISGLKGFNAPPQQKFALFQVPRIEGTSVPWRPILIGHEVAHVAVDEYRGIDAFKLDEKFVLSDPSAVVAPGLPPTDPVAAQKVFALHTIALNWTRELLCDIQALVRFGPSSVAALSEYLHSLGPTDRGSGSHPPTDLRIRLLLELMPTITSARIQSLVEPWNDQVPTTLSFSDPRANHLATLFMTHKDELLSIVEAWPTDGYLLGKRESVIEAIADSFTGRLPVGPAILTTSGEFASPTNPDIVNASWVARNEGLGFAVNALSEKSVDDRDFVNRWVDAGGALPLDLYQPRTPSIPSSPAGAVLNGAEIIDELTNNNESSLRIIPLLHRPKGAGVDLRLGNRFIVFRRTSTAFFDPIERQSDPRSVQSYLQLSWSEDFILHPNELILGCSLEYLRLPGDLTGQVITRSSYGRLGLLSATAVQVHPHFRGCLTLELVNLSTIPLKLSPGERIAQLVFTRTSMTDPGTQKYVDPIGPQFSEVLQDPESRIIWELRHPK